jgi:hypothetical protein
MIQRTLLFVYFCLFSSVTIWAQNPIGLRASSYLRGIPFGTAVRVTNLRQNIDYNEYNEKLKSN